MPPPFQIASAWSSAQSPTDIATRVADTIAARLQSPPALAILLATELEPDQLRQAAALIRSTLNPAVLIACSAKAIIAAEGTLTDAKGLGILAITDINARPFTLNSLEDASDEDFPASVDRLSEIIGATDNTRATLLFANHKGLPIQSMLPPLNAARGLDRTFPILGTTIEDANLILDDTPITEGLVGVSLSGDFRFDAFTSQGATPVSPDLIVTSARGNLIRTLAAKPALQALTQAHQAAGMDASLLLARLVDENRPSRGRGDYLLRTIVGIDEKSGSIAVDEIIHTGQTVRFHRRDPESADADLAMLLDGHKLDGTPAGAIVFASADRKVPEGVVIARAFAQAAPGSSRSRGGQELRGLTQSLPLIGPAGAGEIGPVRGVSYLHRESAVVGLFRAPDKTLFTGHH